MRLFFLAATLLLALQGVSQNYIYRVHEHVDLLAVENQSLNQRNNEISYYLLKSVESGEIEPYSMIDNQIQGPISIGEFHENMQMNDLESEWLWDAEEYYFWDETVNYKGRNYVSLAEDQVGNKPDEVDSEYWAIYVAPKYFFREASTIILDYTVEKSKRNYQFVHFFISSDNTNYGMDQYVVSLKYGDCIEVLNKLNIPWYQPAFAPWRWVTGDIFNIDYYDFSNDFGKGKMIYDLISAGQAGKVPMKSRLEENEINEFALGSLDGSRDQGFDFTFDKKNRIDSIRIMGSQYADSYDQIFEFEGKSIKSTLLKKEYNADFDGFLTISQAFENNLLVTHKTDTISINGNFLGTGKDPISAKFESNNVIASKPASSQFVIFQSSSYNLDQYENSVLNRDGYEFGQVVHDAIVNNEISDIYTNDSMSQKMTLEEFQKRLEIYSEEEEYMTDPWDEDYEYYEGDLVTYENILYYALVDGEKGKVPSLEFEYWEKYQSVIEVYEGRSFTKLNVVTKIIFDAAGKILSREPVALGIYVGAEYTPEGIYLPVCYIRFVDFESISNRDGRAQHNEVPYSELIRQGKLRGSIFSTSAIEFQH